MSDGMRVLVGVVLATLWMNLLASFAIMIIWIGEHGQ